MSKPTSYRELELLERRNIMSKPTSYRELELLVIRWAEARKIIPNSTAKAQAQKTLEECGELLEAATALYVLQQTGVSKDAPVYKMWLDKYKDAVGDVMVTLINGCALADVNLVNCMYQAYDEIKDRKGHMNKDGIFVKQS
jgi:NTP pyrophosphatase (non-canonical NTP hydrolase)